jgi:hypothetical protein
LKLKQKLTPHKPLQQTTGGHDMIEEERERSLVERY